MEILLNDLNVLMEVKNWHWGLALSYLLGSIPFGLLVSKFFLGYDIRLKGSGNIGMSNVARHGGKAAGLAVLILDVGKAVLGIRLTVVVFDPPSIIVLAAGGLAVLGHVNSIFLGFKGGKGVASNFGVWLMIDWRVFVVLALVWTLTFLWKKISGLSSVAALIVLSPTVVWLRGISSTAILALLISIYLIALHRSNIQRLSRGEEPRLTKLK